MKGWTYTFSASRTPQGLVIAARPYFDRVVAASLALGEVCDLTIAEHVEKRSNAQNRMMWSTVYDQLIEGLAREIGYEKNEKDQLHEACCALYGGTVIDKVTGQAVRKFRTSTATKQEFTEYVEWLARWAAQEHGVVIVLPGEAA